MLGFKKKSEAQKLKDKILSIIKEAKARMVENEQYAYAIKLLNEAEALTEKSDTKTFEEIGTLRQKARVLLVGYFIYHNVLSNFQHRRFWHALEDLNKQTERIKEAGFANPDNAPWIEIDKMVTEYCGVNRMSVRENIPKNITELRKLICAEGLRDERINIGTYRMPQDFSSLLVSLGRIKNFADAGELDITDIDMDKLYKEARIAGIEYQKIELCRILEKMGKIMEDAGVEDTIGDFALVDTELMEEKIYDIKQKIRNVKKT